MALFAGEVLLGTAPGNTTGVTVVNVLRSETLATSVAVPSVARTCHAWTVPPLRPLTVTLVAEPTEVQLVHGVPTPSWQYS